MTYFSHTEDHPLNCNCSFCMDVDPNKSVSRELERYIEELSIYSIKELNEEQQKFIHEIGNKILVLRRYFPTMELPVKHARLINSLDSN
jgi:hypothetical protein